MREWLGNADVTDIDPMSPFTTSIKFQRSKQLTTLSTPGFHSTVTQVRHRSDTQHVLEH